MKETREKKRTKRDAQARESKDRIYEAGIRLFTEKGFDETSIAEICRKAECSVGAFYHYFATKDSIIEENFRRTDRQVDLWGTLAGENGAKPVSVRESVLSFFDSYAQLVKINGLEFSKRFYTWKNKNFIKKGRPMQNRLADLLRRGNESGAIALLVSPEEACEWLFLCARGVVFHWCLHEGSFELAAEMRTCIGRALRGIESGSGVAE